MRKVPQTPRGPNEAQPRGWTDNDLRRAGGQIRGREVIVGRDDVNNLQVTADDLSHQAKGGLNIRHRRRDEDHGARECGHAASGVRSACEGLQHRSDHAAVFRPPGGVTLPSMQRLRWIAAGLAMIVAIFCSKILSDQFTLLSQWELKNRSYARSHFTATSIRHGILPALGNSSAFRD